jgi:hypothetical protein
VIARIRSCLPRTSLVPSDSQSNPSPSVPVAASLVSVAARSVLRSSPSDGSSRPHTCDLPDRAIFVLPVRNSSFTTPKKHSRSTAWPANGSS